MTIDVKICGLSTRATIDAAVGAGASHIGFVFFPASPRNVGPDEAAALGRDLGRTTRVGVFVDPDDVLLDRAAPALDELQLTTTLFRLALQRSTRAMGCRSGAPPGSRHAMTSTRRWRRATVTRLLFDAKAPRGSALPGGNGVRFDWRLLDGVPLGRRWGLSGGLDAASVGDAVRCARPPLVDVSSGVEDAPGVKSVSKIKAFIAAARAA